MTPLSPERQQLLLQVVDIQDRMLTGIVLVFSGLSKSSDSEVVSISKQALSAINTNRDILEAMIGGLNETRH